MKRIICLLFVTNFLTGQIQTLQQDSAIKDLAILYSLLNNIHPGQFMHCSKTNFDKCYDSLVRSINSDLTPMAHYCKTQFLVAKIKDGHTWVDNSTIRSGLQDRLVFPFSIHVSKNTCIISKCGLQKYDSLIGSVILGINGKNISDIVVKASSLMSIEGANETAINNSLEYLPFYYFLIDTSSQFTVQLIGKDGTVKQATVSGVSYKSFVKRTRKIVEPIKQDFPSPNIAVLTINTFNKVDFEFKKIDYEKYIDDFFKQVSKEKIENLIIDVRNNNGGSAEISSYLFSYLSDKPYFYFDYVGKKYRSADSLKQYCTTPNYLINPDTTKNVYQGDLYCEKQGYWWYGLQKNKKKFYSGKLGVLINGACFSTTGHFLTLLRDNNIGQLIGECSQGSFYSNDGGIMFKLPHSKFLVRIPNAQFKMKTLNFKYNPKGICPDIEVTKQKEDFITGYDRQFSEAINWLNGFK